MTCLWNFFQAIVSSVILVIINMSFSSGSTSSKTVLSLQNNWNRMVWCLHDSQCPLYLISLGHLLQREPVALLVQPESGDDQPLVPVLQQLRLGLARFELVFCPLSVVCPVRLLGLSDSNRHAVKVRPPVASNRLGLDERLRGEPPLLVLLLLDDQHQVGPHHHVGSAGPCTCHSHTSSVQTTNTLQLLPSSVKYSS